MVITLWLSLVNYGYCMAGFHAVTANGFTPETGKLT